MAGTGIARFKVIGPKAIGLKCSKSYSICLWTMY